MTDAQGVGAAERYRAGESRAKVGHCYDVDQQTVSRGLKKRNIMIPIRS